MTAKTAHLPNVPGKLADPALVTKLLDALAECGNVRDSARAAGVSTVAICRRLKTDPAFAELFAEARAAGNQALEDEARRRAYHGVKEPVIWQGRVQEDEVVDARTGQLTRVPRTVTRYSDTLLIFLLNGAFPEKYKYRSEVSGPNGKPLAHELTVRFVTDPPAASETT